MKSQLRIVSLSLFVILSLAVAVVPAAADDILYSNGPYNGEVNAWEIGNGIAVSDSFNLGKAAQIKAISFVAWVIPGDTISEVDGSFSATENGPAGTTYSTTKSNVKIPSIIGTIELRLPSRVGDPAPVSTSIWMPAPMAEHRHRAYRPGRCYLWDENSGPSLTYQSALGAISSESSPHRRQRRNHS